MIQPLEKMISDEIKKLVPVLGKENAERLNRAYLLGDKKTRERIFEMVDTAKAAVFSNKELAYSVLMEPPPQDMADQGDLKLGNVLYGNKTMYPFSIQKDDLLTHVAVFGSSGYGKTNISYCMVEQLSKRGVPVIIFDFSKRNYKDLLSTDLKDRIEIFTVGRGVSPLKFNPLIPPEGVLESQWMKEFATVFDHAYWLLGGGRHVILKAFDSVLQKKGKPRLSDLKEWLNEYGSTQLPVREKNWLATATRPLDSLCFRELGEVFECDEGIRPSEFFKPGKITILELDALDTNDKTFFIEITLQWIRDWLLIQGEREKLVGAIVLEEAHHVLNREKARKLGSETVMDLVFREVRELGLGVIYCDQHPSLVSYPAMGNTSTHIYMNLGLDTKHSSDIQDASAMLGLRYEDESNYLRKVPVGQGFVMRRGFAFNDPFLVKFNKYPIVKGTVTDQDIREFMSGKIRTFESETMSETPQNQDIVQEEVKEEQIPLEDLNTSDWKIIKTIGHGMGTFASQIYKNIGISGSTFNKRVERLIDIGLVGVCEAKIRKNRLKYHFLTDQGEKAFSQKYMEREIRTGMNIDNILEMLSLGGWQCHMEDHVLVCTNKDKQRFEVYLQNEHSRKNMIKSIQTNRTYLCASDGIRNLLIEKCAELSSRNQRPITIFVSTIDEFEKQGRFDNIEFGA
jgi:DNA-binding MarR family transcriptional regulator